jgi:hypothetical protein
MSNIVNIRGIRRIFSVFLRGYNIYAPVNIGGVPVNIQRRLGRVLGLIYDIYVRYFIYHI